MELTTPPSMESGLKHLFSRKRSKSKPPAPKDTLQDSFQQTSGYAAVASGPAPKVGALPFKPSQEKQPKKSFTHTKAKTDSLREARQVAESANIGRPRTSPVVKPYFVGVSRPDGSGTPSGPSSHGASIDVVVAAGDIAPPPPVPPLPKDVDSLQGPRYHDIMQFAAKQQISRATFNEHIATRNMGLPRRSVDIFEAGVNQLSAGRYNEHVAKRNIDLTRQSINRFEEDVALRNTVLPHVQHASFDATRAPREDRRYQSRSDSMDKDPDTNPGQSMAGAETSANTQVARTGKGKPSKTENGAHISTSDRIAKATAPSLQGAQPSKVASHSRQHSWKQNDHPCELSATAQSRTADFMPPEWLSHGNTTAPSEARTKSMTAAIPPRSRSNGPDDLDFSAQLTSNGERKGPTQSFWDARKQLSQHSTSRSLSMLEGSSGRDAFRPTTSMGQRGVVTPRFALHMRPSSRTGHILEANIPRDMPQASPGSDSISRTPSMATSTASSTRKRIDGSGRMVMDLTDDHPDRYADNVGQSEYHELLGEPEQKALYRTKQTDLSRRPLEPSTIHALEQRVVSKLNASQSAHDPKSTSSRVGRNNEREKKIIPPLGTAPSSTKPTASIGNNSEHAMTGSTSQSAEASGETDSQVASSHSQVTVPTYSLASKSRQQDQLIDQDCEETLSAQSEHVYATPESLKSNDFTDPSRAFGVATRDFAVSPTQKQGQGTLKMPQPQNESQSDKLAPRFTAKLPSRQDKVVHHISSFTWHPNKPRTRQSFRDQIAFDEDAFQRKQAEAHAAMLRLERDLQENFTFAFDSLNKASARGASAYFRDLSLEEGGPVAPISRFSGIQAPTSIYQTKFNGSTTHPDASLGERSRPQEPSIPGLATTPGISGSSIPSTFRNKNRRSMISTISETETEPPSPTDPAPAPTIPLSPASDRGRTMTSRQSAHGRMHSTASTRSGSSIYSVPPNLVPERTSSIRDSDEPPFHIGEAGWE
jgi:hypothetical protein